MHRPIVLASLFVILCAAPVSAQKWATDMFETTKHDFGTVARGAKVEYRFKLKNNYLEDVHISGVSSSCGCTQVRVEKPLLKTYETGEIIATINTRAFWGQKGATLTVTFDKPYYAQVQLHDSVYIRGDVDFNPGSVAFGEIDQGQKVQKTVAVSHTGRSDWRVVDVHSDNPHITGKVSNGRMSGGRITYDLIVEVDKEAPEGYLQDHLMLVTNDHQSMKQVPLLVEGRVVSGITVSPAPLFLGVVEPGEKVRKQVVVRAKKPFKILSVECKDDSVEFDPTHNSEAKSLHLIPVTFIGGQEKGKVNQTIHIKTDLNDQGSDVPIYAVVADPNDQ